MDYKVVVTKEAEADLEKFLEYLVVPHYGRYCVCG